VDKGKAKWEAAFAAVMMAQQASVAALISAVQVSSNCTGRRAVACCAQSWLDLTST